MASLTVTSPSLPRRRLALALDLALGPVAFFTWVAAGVAATGSLHSSNNLVNIVCGGLPGALWVALLLALAWRGQTPGQALVQLRWVDSRGRRVRWRPLGEVGFWGASLYVLAAPVYVFVAVAIMNPLNVTLNNTALGLLACGIVALVALIVARQTRRDTARLVRLDH